MIFASQFLDFTEKKILKSWWCDICWGLYQTNMFSYVWRTRFVGQVICAALQYYIKIQSCHTLYLQLKKQQLQLLAILLLWWQWYHKRLSNPNQKQFLTLYTNPLLFLSHFRAFKECDPNLWTAGWSKNLEPAVLHKGRVLLKGKTILLPIKTL